MLFRPRKSCSSCKNLAIYGYKTQIACETHRTKDMFNLVERTCINCGLTDILDSKDHCQACGDFKFKRTHLAKQKDIKAFLDQSEIKYDSYDRQVDSACGRERPDFVISAPTHTVILEVDENQHMSYSCECEQARMVNITQAIGQPTIFIRYNPDRYKASTKQASQAARKKKLLDWIHHAIRTDPKDPSEFLRVVHLFFDGYDESNISIESIPVL